MEDKKKYLIYALILGLFALLAFVGYKWYSAEQKAVKTPININYSDLKSPEKVSSDLNVDSKTAAQVVKQIEYIHDGKTAPDVTYTITAPTLEQGAKDTQKAIASNETTLPKQATEQTDRTVVTANTDKQTVDVYKINLRNNHKIKVGSLMTYDNGSMRGYIGAGYQAGRVEVMAYYGGGTSYAGAVNYTLKEW